MRRPLSLVIESLVNKSVFVRRLVIQSEWTNRARSMLGGMIACVLLSSLTGNAASPEHDPASDAEMEVESEEIATLSIGSVAPPLNIEHYLDATQSPMIDFEPGKVTVVEFWATWCAPCVLSMPHLAALQERHKHDGLRIISVSDESLETVQKFCERPIPARVRDELLKHSTDELENQPNSEDPITFGELTSVYTLATDPDKSTKEDYLYAAKQRGVPTAFVVGKDGCIEWIGHPRAMDEPLEKIINYQWDRQTAIREFKLASDRSEAFTRVASAQRSGDDALMLEVIETNEAIFAGSMYEPVILHMRLTCLLKLHRNEQALPLIIALAKRDADDPVAIDQWAAEIVEANDPQIDDSAIALVAREALQSAIKHVTDAGNDESALWAQWKTLARLQAIGGDRAAAMTSSQKAIALAPEEEREAMQVELADLLQP